MQVKILDAVEKSPIEECVSAIERDGYVRIPQVFSQDVVSDALERVRYWYDRTVSEQSDRMPVMNLEQPMVYNLQAKDLLFNSMVLDNEITEFVLKHFLNDRWFTSLPEDAPNYILRALLARSSNYQMPMHIDSFIPYMGAYVFIMQCSILLEDQSLDNGCTVVVPGSHLFGEYASQEAFHDATPIEGRAGDLVIWDSRIWHAARANQSEGTRWSIVGTFCRWWIKQAFDIPGNLPQEIYEQLTDRQKAVLGFCSVPYDDESFGIDMKRSYELLPEKVEDYRR